jgi:hypothetical protein
MKKAVLFICLVGYFCVSAQTKYVLEGTLGKVPIYMTFWDYPDDKQDRIDEATYFYQSALKDIVLEARFENGEYVFWFQQEQFKLQKNTDGKFSGTWSNKKGKPLPVSLRPVAVQTDDSVNAFDKIKEELIRFRKDSTTVFNGKKIDWYSETHSITPMIRLADGYPKDLLDRVNAVLEKMHRGLAMEQLGCTSPFSYSNGKNIEFDIDLGYLDNNLLAFDLFSYYDCGGAHPSGGSEGVLIDLHNGKSYQIDDVLAFDTSAVRQETQNFDQFSKYRQDYFARNCISYYNSNIILKNRLRQNRNTNVIIPIWIHGLLLLGDLPQKALCFCRLFHTWHKIA